MTTPSASVRHDDGPLLSDALISCITANTPPAAAQIQQQADELVAAWFQDSVKAEYEVVDHRVVVQDLEPHAPYETHLFGYYGMCIHKAGIETTAAHPSLPELSDFPPPHDRRDKRFQDWTTQEGHTSNYMSQTYEVTAPHPAVLAEVYLWKVLPGQRSILALFELKPTPGQG